MIMWLTLFWVRLGMTKVPLSIWKGDMGALFGFPHLMYKNVSWIIKQNNFRYDESEHSVRCILNIENWTTWLLTDPSVSFFTIHSFPEQIASNFHEKNYGGIKNRFLIFDPLQIQILRFFRANSRISQHTILELSYKLDSKDMRHTSLSISIYPFPY